MISAQYLVEAFKNPTPNAPFATINYTHNAALRSLAYLFTVIPKSAEQQSINRHNVQLLTKFHRWAARQITYMPKKRVSRIVGVPSGR